MKQGMLALMRICLVLAMVLAIGPTRSSSTQAAGGSYNVPAGAAGLAPAGSILYAKPGGLTSGLCVSWANACELRYALGGSVSGQEIWAAAGVYKPTTVSINRNATFQLKNGVAVYGGFAGTETVRTQRDPAAHVTILSGDIDGNDSQSPIVTDTTTVTGTTTNSYHVVTGATGATLDGFTVTAGQANGAQATPCTIACGGGMHNYYSSPALVNITFSGNSADDGGGMYNDYSNPSLTNVTFSGNSASDGGGMYNFWGNPALATATFSGNSATYGSGIYNWAGSPSLTNVTFSGNSASDGGGMYNTFYSGPVLTNVTFSGNSAYTGGGMSNTANSSPVLMNVTFSGNSASIYGGGMYNHYNSNPRLNNVIIANSTGGDCLLLVSSTLNAASAHNLIEDAGNACGLTNGVNGNIVGSDPLLGALGNYGGSTPTLPLLPGSPAIDAGDACADTDQRGVTRPQNIACDIGAYETQWLTTTTTLTSTPNPATWGQVVTFTALVTSSVGLPMGSITFTIDSLSVNVPLDVNGQAVYITDTLAVGTHPVIAAYSGLAGYSASTGALHGGQTIDDVSIIGLTALNSSPTRLTGMTFFTATISAGSGVTYQWNFDEGQTACGAQVHHRYASAGIYTATVTATNSIGSITATTAVTIERAMLYLPVVMNRYGAVPIEIGDTPVP